MVENQTEIMEAQNSKNARKQGVSHYSSGKVFAVAPMIDGSRTKEKSPVFRAL